MKGKNMTLPALVSKVLKAREEKPGSWQIGKLLYFC
jgi:hypothetical protein